MSMELIYVTDPYCIWCFGFAQTIHTVANENRGRLAVSVLNGGMIPSDMPLATMFARFPDPVGLHQRVMDMSGQQFGASYMAEIAAFRTSKRILNSTMPARATATLRRLGVEDELGIATAIQEAYYHDNKDLQVIETYAPIANRFGVRFSTFRNLIETDEISQDVWVERQTIQRMGLQGFPAVILKIEDKAVLIGSGFMPAENLRENLLKATGWEMTEVLGAMCGLDGKGC
ncbi:DsbA family protein [Pseudomonas sp. CC120222-01a]|uniref:DsbA family protein n=1 Tax=Pseudomonas sp. CC120222-01a TaxID=1378075 RepID=UPI000D90869D|nr:DsbA family protein [Pseudomonas sp. CC120222-01a]PVZ41190.1 putative protein-disulfide isomerase [Pseudomonas sp. CC120222-01a]